MSTLFNAIKPDPAVLEFAGRVACISAIAAAIRAKLNPEPADITGVMQEINAVLEYLVKHFPAEEVPRINVNKAEAIDLESGLSLTRSEAAAIIQYRTQNGSFKSIEDLKKVPGVDAAKIEAKKDRLTF